MRTAIAVTLMGLSTLGSRRGSSSVAVIGIAGVVAVFVSVLAIADGLSRVLSSTGHADRAIVLRTGAPFENMSSLSDEVVAALESAPGIARSADGTARSVAEVLISGRVQSGTGTYTAVTLRGTSPDFASVRPEIRISEGRMYTRGLRELVVGKSARAQSDALQIGSTIRLGNTEWRVTGVFESSGDAHESELLTDAATLQSTMQRTRYSSMTVLLESPQAFDRLTAFVANNPTLSVDVVREPAYFERQSGGMPKMLRLIAHLVGLVMALGAAFAALNTMYLAVHTRVVEISTLRAIGFGAGGIVLSVLVEACLLALVGALLGAGLAWLLLNGSTMSTIAGMIDGGQVAFRIDIGAKLISIGVLGGCVVGFLGGAIPAVHAARLPIARALRGV